MAHFTTFYSYKGGVGRTLALANVAWILANHSFEPARVLVIDFDLGAPGLHRVFGMNRAASSSGVVDYVCHFLETAEIPDIRGFIHKTSYDLIDILPAGRLDRLYQSRLEMINWKEIYEAAHGYQLIEQLKRSISAIEPNYDYVLIDSLTGYSDVGGICVRQIPDSVVLLFRLNQQNLDGIRNVYGTLKGAANGERRVPLLPVITPSWPFLDDVAVKWISKAQEVFPDEQLLEISFDSGLSFGERIISALSERLPLASKVLADYRGLAARIREQNSSDPLTIWTALQVNDSEVSLDEVAESYLQLLRKRPHSGMYWDYLPRIWYDLSLRQNSGSPLRSRAVLAIIDFIIEEATKGNKLSFLARARLSLSPWSEDLRSKFRVPAPLEDVDKALRVDADFYEARLLRGQVLLSNGRYHEAIDEFKKCLLLAPNQSRQRARLEINIAATYLRLLKPGEALEHLGAIAETGVVEVEISTLRGKALYLLGDYPKALEEVQRFGDANSYGSPSAYLPSQVLAAMGLINEASEQLRKLSSRHKKGVQGLNLAEAYLAVDPSRALALLEGNPALGEPQPRLMLTLLAQLLTGADAREIRNKLALAPKPERLSHWDLFEVVAMIRAKARAALIDEKSERLAYQIIKASVDIGEVELKATT